MEANELESALVAPLDEPQIGDAWTEELPPWTSEPTGPGVVYLLRVSSEDGLARGNVPMAGRGYDEDFMQGLRSNRRLIERCEVFEYHSFEYPERGYIAPNMDHPASGIYGFVDGIGDWAAMPRHRNATWQVIAVRRNELKESPAAEVGVVRAPRGWVVYSGDALGAMLLIIPKMARNPRLSEAACDDDAQFWGHLVRQESRRAEIGSLSDNVVSFAGCESKAFTFGAGKFAVASEGMASAQGLFGCAAVLNGGAATSAGFGDAFARAPGAREARREGTPIMASAGDGGRAVALGRGAAARAGVMGAIFLTEYSEEGGPFPMSVFAGIIDGVKLKPDVWYRLEHGAPVEC